MRVAYVCVCAADNGGLAGFNRKIIGHSSLKSTAFMNKAVVLFLEKAEQVNMLVETGIWAVYSGGSADTTSSEDNCF